MRDARAAASTVPLRGPDVAAMRRFVCERAIQPDGAVLSWVNPKSPGFAYPEVAGFAGSWLAHDDGHPELLSLVARRLLADAEAGAVGRDGVHYAFDTAMACAGLRAAGAREELVAPLSDFVNRCIRERRACVPPRPEKWSTTWGCHLLKLALHATDGADPAVSALRDGLLPLQLPDGRFVTHAGAETTYLHASCYAAEGLSHLSRHDATLAERSVRHARWLARVQHADGGLPAWHDGERGFGPRPADVVAQAVRLWVLDDPLEHARSIERALGFLARMQHVTGGLAYAEGSDDANTWATLFALQACAWAAAGGPVSPLF